jgi:hypothetical protein
MRCHGLGDFLSPQNPGCNCQSLQRAEGFDRRELKSLHVVALRMFQA